MPPGASVIFTRLEIAPSIRKTQTATSLADGMIVITVLQTYFFPPHPSLQAGQYFHEMIYLLHSAYSRLSVLHTVLDIQHRALLPLNIHLRAHLTVLQIIKQHTVAPLAHLILSTLLSLKEETTILAVLLITALASFYPRLKIFKALSTRQVFQ